MQPAHQFKTDFRAHYGRKDCQYFWLKCLEHFSLLPTDPVMFPIFIYHDTGHWPQSLKVRRKEGNEHV